MEDNDPDYRGVLKSFNDPEKVIEFIHIYATKLNINPTSIFLRGSSSGAGIAQYLISQTELQNSIKGASLNAPQASYYFLEFNLLFSEFQFDLYQYLSTNQLENRIINFYGGSHISELESSIPIIHNRNKISFTNSFDTYNGRLRIVAGNIGKSYQTLTSMNELLHHQIHAIDIYTKSIK